MAGEIPVQLAGNCIADLVEGHEAAPSASAKNVDYGAARAWTALQKLAERRCSLPVV